jgi:hypothetical protein
MAEPRFPAGENLKDFVWPQHYATAVRDGEGGLGEVLFEALFL